MGRDAVKRFLVLALLVFIPTVVAAGDRPDRPHWSLELKGGTFFPDVDQWSKFYGSSYLAQFGGTLSYKVLRQLEVGLGGSYGRATGTGQQLGHGTTAGESTFQQAPLDVFVLGRGIFSEDQLLVPYAGGGYTRMFYRIGMNGEQSTQGSVNGYHGRAGVQILLDRLDREAADNLYKDYGLYHTYFFAEGKYTRAMADTNPSGSVNLGGASCLGGFMFEF